MGSISLSRSNDSISYQVTPPVEMNLRDEEIFPHYFQRHELPPAWLIMNLTLPVPGIPPLERIFRGMKVFDFDPWLLKRAVPIMGKTELEKDGSNLAIVIKNILEDPAKKTEFLTLIRDMLPFVDEVAVEKFMDMSLFLKLKEVYSKNKYLPASVVSVGTINIMALVRPDFLPKTPRHSWAERLDALRDIWAVVLLAMRGLSARKDASAKPFISSVFNDPQVNSAIRGEAAIALGMLNDEGSIPSLMNGVVDPDEKTRLGSTKALSLFAEEDTREPLMKMLEQLDVMRMDAIVRAIVRSGWKPVGVLLKLAESTDYQTSRTAISILGSTGDPRAADLLLKLLAEPGPREI